ncbi:non-specific lipid-transfer protein 8-like [Iris pallida]|uniref:Non-specific lipid-transfer protein n=1 Tax=Iris pallida TaxID=29817 RepID=A0AAX6FC98_IRIPA|nr:non-specific lipid-transfer protein 8-like [Iris pallida]KAJ6813641.1 non-specific lipid-transfer protein 8-like [Iris pallida]
MKQYISFSFMAAMLLLSLHHLQDSEAAIQCSDVLKDLSPCSSYLSTGSGSPSTACCGGLSAVVSAASTTADRRAACSCIVSAMSQNSPNITAAAALPGLCGVTLPFPISANIDCSKIS